MKRILILILIYGNFLPLMGQADSLVISTEDTTYSVVPDTLKTDKVPEQRLDSIGIAMQYLKEIYLDSNQWINPDDSLRLALGRILEHVENGPIKPTVTFLRSYPFERMEIPLFPVKTDKIPTKVPGDSIVIEPVQDTLMMDSLEISIDSVPLPVIDSTQLNKADSIFFTSPDSIVSLEFQIEQADTLKIIFTDSTRQVFQDTLLFEVGEATLIPLKVFSQVGSTDSLKSSIDLLLNYIEDDSLQVWFKNITDDSTSIWLSNETAYKRFWLKNEVFDSIGIWIENDHKNSLKFIVDDGVYFRKMWRSKKTEYFLTEQQVIKNDLQKMQPIVIKPKVWNYGGLGALNFAQGYLSNWAKGGESSISAFSELNLFANYSKNNTKWDNSVRVKYGLIKSGEKRLRKNEDLLEINSKFGQKAFGRLGERAIDKYGTVGIKDWYYSLLISFKSQFANGYNYPNDSVAVSRFMAPGYLMFALGLDYKPSKTTSILVSPITSKSTYVLDTALIDQTKYGVASNKRVYREVGAYVKTRFLHNFNDDISVENKLDLFTNYSHNPQNIDINWEVVLRMKITYYLSATISTHLIYDDDVNVPVYDNEGVKIGEGPRLQFKELLSLGFSYKF